MKILWLAPGTEDYQSDALFHGLRTLHGADVADVPRCECMYRDGAKARYGRGFTLFNLLPSLDVDREDIPLKLATGYFDRVFIGGDWIYNPAKAGDPDLHIPYFPDVARNYGKTERLAIIDGADHRATSPLAHLGVYFKRENAGTGLPIHFAIPSEKMTCGPLTGRKLWADYRPGMTYRYEREDDYYADYRGSWFARTCKKQGWDCLRHREIMACGTIPFFGDIADLPETICKDLPRKLLSEVVADNWPETMISEEALAHAAQGLYDWCIRYCTTTALAKYVLGNLR